MKLDIAVIFLLTGRSCGRYFRDSISILRVCPTLTRDETLGALQMTVYNMTLSEGFSEFITYTDTRAEVLRAMQSADTVTDFGKNWHFLIYAV